MSCKKGVLKNLQDSKENICARVSSECNSRIFGQRPGSLKKGTSGVVLPRKTLKLHCFWKKGALFCQILQGAASDYRTLISFGLFLDLFNKVAHLLKNISDGCFCHFCYFFFLFPLAQRCRNFRIRF